MPISIPTVPLVPLVPTMPLYSPVPSVPSVPSTAGITPALTPTQVTPRLTSSMTPRLAPTVPVVPAVQQVSTMTPRTISTIPQVPTVPAAPTVPTVPQAPSIIPRGMEVTVQNTITTPVDVKSLTFQTPGMADQTVEKKITELGFMPLVKTITRKPDGSVEARYIKAVDSLGNISYIQLNVDSNVSVHPSDLTTTESLETNNVPYAIKTGAIAAVGLDVSGVALECANGICTLSQDSPDRPRVESFLTYIEKPKTTVVVEEDSPVAYPIIRLSDVLENPTLVMLLVVKATTKLRWEAYQMSVRTLINADNVLKDTYDKGKITLRAINIALNHIMSSLNDLEDKRRAYELHPPSGPVETERYDLLIYNIKYRQDKLKELLLLERNVTMYVSAFNQLSMNFSEMQKELDDRFGGILGTIYKPVKQ